MVGRRRTSNVSANRRVRMKDGAGVVLLSSVRLERIEGPFGCGDRSMACRWPANVELARRSFPRQRLSKAWPR